MGTQDKWRFCGNCASMFWNALPWKGVCRAGSDGVHFANGFEFNLPFDEPESQTVQRHWAFCKKCLELFWDGLPDRKGVCPAGGGHDGAGSFDFSLPHHVPATPNAQDGWRFCEHCMAMFWDGDPAHRGPCPGSPAGHSPQDSFPFVLPHYNDAKTVVVTLHNIFNDNTGDDPGNSLEIYGRFDVTRLNFRQDTGELVPLGSFNLFDRSEGDAQDIVEGTAFIVENSVRLMIFKDEFLQITGHLKEDDDFGDDDLGNSRDIRIPFQGITNAPIDLGVFEDSDQRVVVNMSAAVL
ncbi:hypothetical protein [Streptomyces sp. NRRL S-87]|uniref:hypothetical protein n=1 Tax=Streptomyces sp. NRRL S-87 TaxID=1463920 RepID=UPI00069077DA|nr:hypothetical protein [Streptomyces sp. NRRL S-87]